MTCKSFIVIQLWSVVIFTFFFFFHWIEWVLLGVSLDVVPFKKYLLHLTINFFYERKCKYIKNEIRLTFYSLSRINSITNIVHHFFFTYTGKWEGKIQFCISGWHMTRVWFSIKVAGITSLHNLYFTQWN